VAQVAALCGFSLTDFQQMRAGVDAPTLPAGLAGVTVIFTYLLPEPMRILDNLLQAAVPGQGVRLVTFMAHPQGEIWADRGVIANSRDLLGELQLWERRGGSASGIDRSSGTGAGS
jgi:hypothetical protein